MRAPQSAVMRRIEAAAHHRHDARHDRHGDPGRARALDEGEVVLVVEEELRDQELDAGADLLHEHREVVLGADGASGCVSG